MDGYVVIYTEKPHEKGKIYLAQLTEPLESNLESNEEHSEILLRIPTSAFEMTKK